MASVSIVLRKDKMNLKGEAPLVFRIIKDRKISYISTGFKLPVELWDEKKGQVKSRHPNSARMNSFIKNRFAELHDEVLKLETHKKTLTSRQLRDNVFGKRNVAFFTFADEVLEDYKKSGQIGTYDKNVSIINKLRTYVKGRNLAFQDITVDFLKKYERYLRDGLGNKINTINKDFKFLRKVFNDAYKQDLIEYHVNPFYKYAIKSEKTERGYLTEEELIKVENYPAAVGSRIERHRDLFVFVAYAGGLRISDVLKLQWKNIDGERINFCTKKTTAQLSIKMPDKALGIIKKYRPSAPDEDAFIFGLLASDLDLKDAKAVDRAINIATIYANKDLKKIAKVQNISKPLSTHIARHTFATRALRKGVSLDKVSKLLGHSKITQTQLYAKIVDSELDKAMDVFNE